MRPVPHVVESKRPLTSPTPSPQHPQAEASLSLFPPLPPTLRGCCEMFFSDCKGNFQGGWDEGRGRCQVAADGGSSSRERCGAEGRVVAGRPPGPPGGLQPARPTQRRLPARGASRGRASGTKRAQRGTRRGELRSGEKHRPWPAGRRRGVPSVDAWDRQTAAEGWGVLPLSPCANSPRLAPAPLQGRREGAPQLPLSPQTQPPRASRYRGAVSLQGRGPLRTPSREESSAVLSSQLH